MNKIDGIANLKASQQWICWKYEEVNGRLTKIPYNPRTGGKAMSNNPETWAPYEMAKSLSAQYDGIGFMFADGICGIDLDGIDNEQTRRDAAQDIIQLMDTYTEYSPSAKGLHILFRMDTSRLPQNYKDAFYQKNPNNGVEAYLSGITHRYFTYTEARFNDKDIEDRTEQFLTFLDRYMQKKAPSPLPHGERAMPSPTTGNIVTFDVISIARNAKNARKFVALFDNGDISAYNNDDSSADLALANMLAFYCNGNANEIDRYFRQSALMRPKWERADYRETTIRKAVAMCGSNFYRGKQSAPAPSREILTIDAVKDYLIKRGISIRYNIMNHTIDIHGANPLYSAENLAENLPIIAYENLKRKFKRCPKQDVFDFFRVIADINRYNPVIDMLNAVSWDRQDRLPALFDILRLTDADRLSKTLVYRWLWQCLSMARNDFQNAYGADGLLCLVGKQGIGKTSFFRKLAVHQNFFYEGQHLDFGDKDTLRRASSAWICELGEVESTLRTDIEKLKAYVTAATDMYRLPYGRTDLHIARRTSLCATANSSEYLIDASGNRRFWTVPVDTIDLEALHRLDVLQLWAQIDTVACSINPQGFRITAEERDELNQRNTQHEKPMKAESEIRDILEQINNPGSLFEYKHVTVLQFKMAYPDALKNYSVNQIGTALNKLGFDMSNIRIDGKRQRLRYLPMPGYLKG